MKIVEPSAHIEELPENIYQRIDKAASVCYQRPAKPTVEEAKKFCRGMIKRKHWMPLEFATVHLVMPWEYADKFNICKFLQVEQISFSQGVVSGSIRAFRELTGDFFQSFSRSFLGYLYPEFFEWDRKFIPTPVRVDQPHEIPWQHEHVAVRVVCSRAISHQLVRHRPCAILQESQRYCRYDGERFDGEVSFIRPEWAEKRGDAGEEYFVSSCLSSERKYFFRLNSLKLSPQEARGVLPNDTKTELLIYAKLPEWQHILNEETMRCSPHADPEMQRIMKPLREEFKGRWPERF